MRQLDQYFIYLDRGHRYALPMGAVVEILDSPDPRPFRGALPGCLGTIIYRGELIPVFDSTALGGASDHAREQASVIILVKEGGVCFALSIERHLTVASLAAVEPAEESDARGEGKRPNFVESALAHEGELLLVLSASRIATLVRGAFGDLRALEEESLDEKAVDIALEERSEAPRYLCATLDHVRLAVPIDRILEIVEGYEVTPLFNVPPGLRGLINLRGQVIACFDLSQDFSLPPRILEERSLFVILDGVGCELALCVDQILGIRPLEREGQQHTDSIWRGEFVRYIDRVLEEEEGTLLFLSVPDVFESLQLQADQRLEG